MIACLAVAVRHGMDTPSLTGGFGEDGCGCQPLTCRPVEDAFLILLVAWPVWAFVAQWVLDNPREDPVTGMFWRLLRGYVRWRHGLTVEGAENIPGGRRAGPLIVVSNHTAGIDPLLIQASCPFEVRWMMGTDMMLPRYQTFWEWTGVIGVNRASREMAGTREAIRHVQSGGVLGVFPEGRIERPVRTLLPFQSGVGLLVARTGAPVLPVWVRDTPDHPRAWGSLWMTSRSRLRVGPLKHFAKGTSPEQITAFLREWFQHESGWQDSPAVPRP